MLKLLLVYWTIGVLYALFISRLRGTLPQTLTLVSASSWLWPFMLFSRIKNERLLRKKIKNDAWFYENSKTWTPIVREKALAVLNELLKRENEQSRIEDINQKIEYLKNFVS